MPDPTSEARPIPHAVAIAHERLTSVRDLVLNIREQVRRRATDRPKSYPGLSMSARIVATVESDIRPSVEDRTITLRLARSAMRGVNRWVTAPTKYATTAEEVESDAVDALDQLREALYHPAELRFDDHKWSDAIETIDRTIDILSASPRDSGYSDAIGRDVAAFSVTAAAIVTALEGATPLPDETIATAKHLEPTVGPLLDYARWCPDSRCPMVTDAIQHAVTCVNMSTMSGGPSEKRRRRTMDEWAAIRDACDSIATTAAHGPAEPKRRSSAVEVGKRLELLRSQGDTFINRKHYAATFFCSESTVSAAIHESPRLMEWAGWNACEAKVARAVPLTDHVAENAHQSTEADPSDLMTAGEVDAAMAAMIDKAAPAERAKLNAMDAADREKVAKLYRSQRRDENGPREYPR